MAPNYVLTYFNVRAFAEPIRYLLSYGNIEFKDVRIEHDDWPKYKSTMPLEQVPLLEINGKPIYQSIAIARYLAKQVGLFGADDWENLQIDMVVDTIIDFRAKLTAAHYDPDAESKATKLAEVKKTSIPFYLKKLEEFAKNNNGYLAVGKLTWADVFFAASIEYMTFMSTIDLLADSPNLKSVVDKVTAIDGIKKWIKKRPVTDC